MSSPKDQAEDSQFRPTDKITATQIREAMRKRMGKEEDEPSDPPHPARKKADPGEEETKADV